MGVSVHSTKATEDRQRARKQRPLTRNCVPPFPPFGAGNSSLRAIAACSVGMCGGRRAASGALCRPRRLRYGGRPGCKIAVGPTLATLAGMAGRKRPPARRMSRRLIEDTRHQLHGTVEPWKLYGVCVARTSQRTSGAPKGSQTDSGWEQSWHVGGTRTYDAQAAGCAIQQHHIMPLIDDRSALRTIRA